MNELARFHSMLLQGPKEVARIGISVDEDYCCDTVFARLGVASDIEEAGVRRIPART